MLFCPFAALTQRLQLLGGAVLLTITFIVPWTDTLAAQPSVAVVPKPPPEREVLEAKTHDIVRLAKSLRGAEATQREALAQQLAEAARERQDLLATLIEAHPEEVLRVALPAKLHALLPEAAKAFVEERLELEGDMEVLVEDYPDGRYRHRFYLKRGFEERVSLHFAGKPPALLTGQQIRVKGVFLDGVSAEGEETTDGAMAFASGEENVQLMADNGGTVDSALADPSTEILPNTFGEQRTLVLLVNFQDKPNEQPWTVEQVRSVVFDQVGEFFRENSYEQTWLSGDVSGWYTIDLDSTVWNLDWIANKANSAAIAAGINLTSYTRHVYLFPRNSGSSLYGAGTMGGNPSQTWLNGRLDLWLLGHEMGHNFGLHHSHALECGATTLGTDCQTYEYGDRLDIMGNYTAGHLNAFQKAQLGWLGYGISPPIASIETSGTYSLEPYELGGDGAKAMKILKGIDPAMGTKIWYYLEYRQALGFDGFLADNGNILNGVVVHKGTDADRRSSFLLDMTPGSSTSSYYDWDDHALEGGISYSDPDAGTIITTAWTDGVGATVHVDFVAQACVRANPTVTLSPSQSQWVVPGTPVTYMATVTNWDDGACGASQFNLQATPPIGWMATLSESALSIRPGQSASTSFTVTSPFSTPDGFYDTAITARNGEATSYVALGSVTYVVSGGNQPPVAVDDIATTVENKAVTVSVLANDFDPEGDPLTVISITQATHGQVSINGDGTVRYVPDRRFKGGDSFSYVITDGVDTATATVTITVQPKSGSGKAGGK